jgi:hypothetical protein
VAINDFLHKLNVGVLVSRQMQKTTSCIVEVAQGPRGKAKHTAKYFVAAADRIVKREVVDKTTTTPLLPRASFFFSEILVSTKTLTHTYLIFIKYIR